MYVTENKDQNSYCSSAEYLHAILQLVLTPLNPETKQMKAKVL